MTGLRLRILTAVLATLPLIPLAGCADRPNGATGEGTASADSSAAVDPSSATSSPVESPEVDSPPIIGSVLDELTPDDDLAFNPPAPANVRAGQVSADGAELVWDPPAPVTVPHSYSDRVVGYRIYRSGDDDIELRPLDTTTELGFVDRSVQPGRTYQYAVASVRELNVEGTRSSPTVTISVP